MPVEGDGAFKATVGVARVAAAAAEHGPLCPSDERPASLNTQARLASSQTQGGGARHFFSGGVVLLAYWSLHFVFDSAPFPITTVGY